MKRWKTVVLCVLVVFLAALVVGCSTSSSTYEFEGTWSALGLETWQFGSTSGSLSVNFIVNYTINFTYTAVDEKAKHILINITSVTGTGAPGNVGAPAYVTYSITGTTIGSSMYADISGTGYPSSASSGPYTKQ